MELQIRDGSPNRNQSMVLNLHFSHRANKYQGSNWFMAEVYETTTQGERQGNPIFYCSGTRFEELEEALRLPLLESEALDAANDPSF